MLQGEITQAHGLGMIGEGWGFSVHSRQGLREQRIISAYIAQSHKIQCLNPWLSFHSVPFKWVLFDHLGVNKGEAG